MSEALDPQIELRPRSLDETGDLAFAYLRVFRADFSRLAAVLSVLAVLATGALHYGVDLGWAATGGLLVAVTGAFDHVVLTFAGRHLFEPSPRVGAALARTLRQLLPTLLVSALCLAPFAYVIGGWDAHEDGPWIANLVIAVCVWPMLVAGLSYFHVIHALEGLTLSRSLQRNRALTAQRYSRALGFVLFSGLARLTAAFVAGSFAEFVVCALLQLAPKDDPVTLEVFWLAAVVGWVLGGVYASLVRVFEYVDARTRLEGWDLQVRFRAIAARLATDKAQRFVRGAAALLLAGLTLASAPARAQEPETDEPLVAEPLEDDVENGDSVLDSITDLGAGEFAPGLDPGEAAAQGPTKARAALAAHVYAFCHDPSWRRDPRRDDPTFCGAWSPEALAACPGAAKLCAPAETPWWRGLDLGLPRWVGWVLLLGLLALVLWPVLRALARGGWGSTPDLEPEAEERAAVDLHALPEAPVRVLLRRAREDLASGRAEPAALTLHAAILRALDDAELIRFHPSRTNREYLGSLRRRPALGRLFRGAVAQTDRIRFGHGRAEPEAVGRLLDEAEPLLQDLSSGPPLEPTAALLVVAATLGAIGQSGCSLPGKRYYDHGPNGSAALVELLEGLGLDVEVKSGRIDEVDPTVGVLVIGSELIGSHSRLRLSPWLDQGTSVVVVADEDSAQLFTLTATSARVGEPIRAAGTSTRVLFREGLRARLGPEPVCRLDLGALEDHVPNGVVIDEGFALAWDGVVRTSSVASPPLDAFPILGSGPESGSGVAAHAFGLTRVDGQSDAQAACIFVFASFDLFSNAGLAFPENAAFVGGFFAALTGHGKKVRLVDRAVPGNAPVLQTSTRLGESVMLPLMAQGLVFAIALLVLLGASFGPPRDPRELAHHAFSEHVVALGGQYARLGQPGEAHAAAQLARWVLHQQRQEAGATSAERRGALALQLAGLHGLDATQVEAALALAEPGRAAGMDREALGPLLRTLGALVSRARRGERPRR